MSNSGCVSLVASHGSTSLKDNYFLPAYTKWFRKSFAQIGHQLTKRLQFQRQGRFIWKFPAGISRFQSCGLELKIIEH